MKEALTISVVIPTLNAEGLIGPLLDRLLSQTVEGAEILVVDSSSTDNTVEQARHRPNVRIQVIDRASFDHGGTRHDAVMATSGGIVCFLTQDAMPASNTYLERLIAPFADPQVAICTGRQLPKPGARRFEQLVRAYNYPAVSHVRVLADQKRYGIQAFRASDVCSAYRRSAYLACGGFPRPCATNEDLYLATIFAHAGYKVAYAADAAVYHSHNLSPREQYRRNFAIGAFLQEHDELFSATPELGEGKTMAAQIARRLLRERRVGEAFAFGVDCAARLLGNRAGRRSVQKGRG